MFQFKINNTTWKIQEETQEEIKNIMKKHLDNPSEEGKYYGLTYFDTQTIYIDKDLCEERQRRTLLHELTHCYIGSYITHLSDKVYTEEDIADVVSNSHDIIREILDKYLDKGDLK